MLKLEARPQASTLMSLASPLLALALTVLVGVGLFMLLGKDPLRGLQMFFVEPVLSLYALSELSVKATPLILIALGLAVCFRSNVWNIGAEGQYVMGALFAGWVAMQAGPDTAWMGRAIVVPILLAGVLGGMLWAGLVALLRDRFNANEILVSLMLVYVAQQVANALVFGPWKDPQGFNMPQSALFHSSLLLPPLLERTRLHVGFLLALVLAVVATLFLFRSFRGFQLQVGGLAPAAARYAGFSARASLWTALLVSGGLAGLAGAMEVAGPIRQVTPYLSTGLGFTAIIVCFVGRLHPLGIVGAGVLLSLMLIGGELAQSRLGLPNAMASVLQGLLLLILLACDTFIHQRLRLTRSRARPA